MSTALQSEDREQRLSRARAALSAAERSAARWGGRIDRTALQPAAPSVPGASAPVGPATVGERPTAGEPGGSAAGLTAADPTGTRLPVPAPLAPLFPRTGLRAGSSVAIEGAGSTSLLLALAAAAAGEDSWCALAGLPDLGLRAALDAGLDPFRLALAPADGDRAPQVLSALADGVGVLVLGPGALPAPALWRTLQGRARTADTLLLAASPPGRADLVLRTESRGWTGLGQGSGRLRRRRLAVTASGRGIGAGRSVEVLLPEVRGLLAAIPGPALSSTAAASSAAGPAAAEVRPLQMVPRAG
ncbi:hypothetical protein V1260_10185 [Brachybacterium sp. J144]|uniref:hypothetical protein n=1 Tax=Brachybacterium sp. J144 TaxID=3116487 RepID=UPI002E777EBD|nr:hypothetical protein [Brachybacterium sp. J144]MEE1651154.1 hypothetical protein [Brachybacterium sp. J144]